MGKPKKYDFGGYATKFNCKCSDGRTILKHAFKDDDGTKVPLVWSHQHNDPEDILGHAYLEEREDGVYAYGCLNNGEKAKAVKEALVHGDIGSLSIYANQLKQNAKKEVIHGKIREVSVVLAGANPEALIDVVLAHNLSPEQEQDPDYIGEATIFPGTNNVSVDIVEHSEESPDPEDPNGEDPTPKDPNSGDPKQDPAEETKTNPQEPNPDLAHKDPDPKEPEQKADTELEHQNGKDKEEESEETVDDIINSMTPKQKDLLYFLVGAASEEAKNGGKQEMKHNAFEQVKKDDGTVLTHSEFNEIINEAKTSKFSLKETFIAHGITNIENLFPEERAAGQPETVSRNMAWVDRVMNSVTRSPFSRVKSMYFDITQEQARAKGYVKGNQKIEEVILALKRAVTPQTVYKLQKLDRDDVIDITDFDVIAYIKAEMRVMLNEELARAILIGDGRAVDDPSKISPEHIKPVWGDNPVYTVNRELVEDPNEDFAKTFIVDVIRSRKLYKGSGKPVLYTTEDMLTDMLLLEDKMGRPLYDTEEKLCTKLRVSAIEPVEVMEGQYRRNGGFQYDLLGVLVNLRDYKVGADKGGAVNMFDDFDINYNKYEYLIETRCSGALVKPFSAITFEKKHSF